MGANTPANRQEHKINPSIEEQILDELRLIRGIQDSTYNQRQRSRQEWDLKEGKSTSELDAMYSINDNTTPNFWKNGVTFMAILALIIALITLFITVITYKEQRKTAINTQKLSKESQIILLLDEVFQIVGIAESVYAAKSLMSKRGFKGYPTESFFDQIRLSNSSLDMIMECSQDEALREMLELKREYERYGHKVNETQTHLMNQEILSTIKEEDLESLIGRCWQLTISILCRVDKISSDHDLITALLKKTFGLTKLTDPLSELVGEPNKYETLEHFQKSIFSDYLNAEELASFCNEFNSWVEFHKKGITIIDPS